MVIWYIAEISNNRTMKYYILSYQWTGKMDGFFYFWRPGSHGYTWYMEEAGLYGRVEALRIAEEGGVIVIPVKEADKYSLDVVYDNAQHKVLPNIGTVRKELALLQTKMNQNRNNCPSSEFMFESYTAFKNSGLDCMDFAETQMVYTHFSILKEGFTWKAPQTIAE